jgi:hypothetical protein
VTDEYEYYEIDFLQELTQVRNLLGLGTDISDDDHDVAKVVAELNLISPHVTVKEIKNL